MMMDTKEERIYTLSRRQSAVAQRKAQPQQQVNKIQLEKQLETQHEKPHQQTHQQDINAHQQPQKLQQHAVQHGRYNTRHPEQHIVTNQEVRRKSRNQPTIRAAESKPPHNEQQHLDLYDLDKYVDDIVNLALFSAVTAILDGNVNVHNDHRFHKSVEPQPDKESFEIFQSITQNENPLNNVGREENSKTEANNGIDHHSLVASDLAQKPKKEGKQNNDNYEVSNTEEEITNATTVEDSINDELPKRRIFERSESTRSLLYDLNGRRKPMLGPRSLTLCDMRTATLKDEDETSDDANYSVDDRKLLRSLRKMAADSGGLRSRSYDLRRAKRLRLLRRQLTEKKLLEKTEVVEEVVEEEKMPPLTLWRKRTKLVCMMCRVCMALAKYSHPAAGYVEMDKYERGMAHRTTNKDEEQDTREEVSFNKNDYKTAYEFTWPQVANPIIRKLPHERTAQDCATIRAIMRNLHSFRKYTDEMQQLLSKVVRYCRYGPKRVVVRKGHVGHSLYFIFSGAVSVVFDKEETSMFARPVEISVLRKGEVFGEIALLKNSTRNATIVCSTDTELLAVDRDEFYQYGLYDLFLKECQYRINFLSNLDLFATWPRSSIEELCYVSRIEPYSYNRVIIKDATKSEWIYFITQGCCELLRLVDLAKSQDFTQVLPASKRPQLRKQAVFLDMKTSAEYMRELTVPAPRLHRRPHTTIGLREVPKLAVNDEEYEIEESDLGSEIDGSVRTSGLMFRSKNGEEENTPGNRLRRAAWAVQAASTINKKKKILGRGTEPDTEYEQVNIGMFVKVDLLRPGQAFGLSNFFEPPRFFSLVSKGAEVIRVPRSKFRELADDVTMAKIRRQHIRSYPGDTKICKDFMRENTWNLFKQDLVDVLVHDSEKRTLKKGVQKEEAPSVRAQSGRERKELLRRCQSATTEYDRIRRLPTLDNQPQSPDLRGKSASPGRRRPSFNLPDKLRQHTVTSLKHGMTSRPKTALVARQPNGNSGRMLNRPVTCSVQARS